MNILVKFNDDDFSTILTNLTGRWFSPGPPVSSTNKTDCHDITEILLKLALNTIKQSLIKMILENVYQSYAPFCTVCEFLDSG
jgi:hypothetical protein